MNKKIIIDFEFTSKDKLEAELLEFCALFVEENKVVDKVVSFVKFDKSWSSLKDDEIFCLKFNKIYSQEDLYKHNAKAKDEKEVLDKFLDKVKSFSDKKLALTGWNNSMADIVILKRVMKRYNLNFEDVFDYHVRDIATQFQLFYDEFFKDKFKLHLSTSHKYLIGTFKDEDFHKAEVDCLATLDLDIWCEKQIKKLKLKDEKYLS